MNVESLIESCNRPKYIITVPIDRQAKTKLPAAIVWGELHNASRLGRHDSYRKKINYIHLILSINDLIFVGNISGIGCRSKGLLGLADQYLKVDYRRTISTGYFVLDIHCICVKFNKTGNCCSFTLPTFIIIIFLWFKV